MLILGLVLAAVAALVHVYIFVLESVRWTHPSTRRVFGTSAEDAETMRSLAFNQGFYNLFLGVMAALGVVLHVAGAPVVGATLALAGTGMMLAAAIVLVLHDASKLRAAVMQGVFPLLAIVATVIGLAIG